MGAIANNILTVTEPTIKLEKFEIINIEEVAENSKSDKNHDKLSKFAGDQFPAIRINKHDFNREDVISFSLSFESMLPTLSIKLKDSKGVFTKSQYPKDGDVLMIYIRSKDENVYKPIRMDFDINEISTSPVSTSESMSGGGENEDPVEISVEGVVRLPGLFAEISKSYPKDTSYNYFIDVAEELQAGFASNDEFTDDEMVRICPYDTRFKLLKDYSDSVYKNDDSFFTLYLDAYYYFNLVNINKQINFTQEFEDTLSSFIQDASTASSVEDGSSTSDDKLYLTNSQVKKGTSFYMAKYRIVNNSANVTLSDGYRRIMQYYDDVSKVYRTFTVEPLTTKELPVDQAPLKGKYDAEGIKMYKEQQKYKYVGKQGANVHDNYYYAQMLNYKNKLELEKMYLEVELETANLSLYRFQIIPVIVIEQSAQQSEIQEQREVKAENAGTAMKEKKGDVGDLQTAGPQKQKVDEKLTGVYTISRINYTYNQEEGRIKQKISLYRREWPNVP